MGLGMGLGNGEEQPDLIKVSSPRQLMRDGRGEGKGSNRKTRQEAVQPTGETGWRPGPGCGRGMRGRGQIVHVLSSICLREPLQG